MMHRPIRPISIAIASLCLPTVIARFLGPLNVPPVDLTSDTSHVQSKWEEIRSMLDGHLAGTKRNEALSGLDNITFSLGLFSVHDAEAASFLQYHHTGPDIRNSSLGVKKVDGDSIYRVASMTKAVSVYAGLLLLDPDDWNKPLTEIFPEITSLPKDDPVHHIQWNTITPFSLASQISGVPANARPFDAGEFATVFLTDSIDPTTLGLPPLTLNSTGLKVPCVDQYCSAVDYIESIQAPTFPVFQTPGYANTNFILLGRVISKLTGLPTNEEWFQKAIFGLLDMTSTSSLSPTEPPYLGYVVAGDPEAFAFEGGITSSSGGIFSTTNDIAKLGISMLNSTLLAADKTRKWMKPTAFTGSLDFALGMGWEIYRYTDKVTSHVTDLYTKLGDAGNYASYLVVVPDYDFGFSVIVTSGIATAAERSAAARLLADIISETILPALRDQAAAETKRKFEGTYSSSMGSNTSTLTLAYNETAGAGFGLTITSLVNDGHDLLRLLQSVLGSNQLVLAPSTVDPKTKRRGFVATAVTTPGTYTGLFSEMFATNAEWTTNNGLTYGGQALGTFYFDVAEDGRAVAVLPAILRGKRFEKRV
ncbi:beta-lactamase/transpeptidase-like protein [Xylaria bambusicola]|uniref:beta-lactamase/transpeptidase-like protein n=1 Tax=Xylaria bambusicola TaxID=326684 RepID=UPI0020081B04|nr:beta-lactamase/transpeptidase-like protein [Xylaria bambusicola]KAI0512927.1 beta-lactamase/transpeptidase-like protein [Xylaria bambusicola]